MFALRSALFPVWLSALLSLPIVAQAQPGVGLTPEEAVRLGLERSAGLRAAEAQAAEAEAIARQVRAGRLPSVQAQASYTRLGGDIPSGDLAVPGLDTTFTILPIERDRVHAEVRVEQPLFTGFRLRHEVRAAEQEAEAAALAAEQEAADAAFAVRQAYWRLVQALAVREATAAALARVEEHLRVVRRRVEEGAALPSDLLSAQTRRAEVRLEQVEAEDAVRVARLELNRLVGLPLDTPVVPEAVAPPEVPVHGTDALVTRALAARPALEALEAQVRGLEARVEATRGTWWPQLAAVGRYVYARPNPYAFTEQSAFQGTWEAGLALQWDLWSGGRRRAETSQARARLASAQARLEGAREQVAVAVTRQGLEVRRAAEAVIVVAEAVRAAEEALRVITRQFEEGAVLAATVLEAEEALRAAEARQAQAHADHAVAQAAVLQALGEVW